MDGIHAFVQQEGSPGSFSRHKLFKNFLKSRHSKFEWKSTSFFSYFNKAASAHSSPPNFFFQLQGILQRWVLMVCLQSVPVRVPSLVPSPQSPSLATHTLHCHSPQSDLRSFFPVESPTRHIKHRYIVTTDMGQRNASSKLFEVEEHIISQMTTNVTRGFVGS